MKGSFDACLAVILKHEGGFVNHPKDPGGMTNLGVTKATYEDWVGYPVSEAIMRNLAPQMVSALYKKRYWDIVRCGDMPCAIALCVFDFAVNAGPSRAARYLQRTIGARDDGQIGPASLADLKAFVTQYREAELVRRYQSAREGYYRKLPTFGTFGRGWLRRVRETETEALGLL